MPHKPERGFCYRDSYMILMEGKYDAGSEECVLCHGFPRLTAADGGTPAGTLYGHAWLERTMPNIGLVVCFDVLAEVSVPRELYYRAGNIDPAYVTRYTKAEASAMIVSHGIYGPWEDNEPDGVVYAND